MAKAMAKRAVLTVVVMALVTLAKSQGPAEKQAQVDEPLPSAFCELDGHQPLQAECEDPVCLGKFYSVGHNRVHDFRCEECKKARKDKTLIKAVLQQFNYCCQSGKLKGWKSGENELCVGPWEAAQAKGAKLAGQEAKNNEALRNGEPLPPPEVEETPSGASAASGSTGASAEATGATGATGASAESAENAKNLAQMSVNDEARDEEDRVEKLAEMNKNKEVQEMQAREATVNAEEKIAGNSSKGVEAQMDAKEVAVSEKEAILNINKGYSEAVKDGAAAQDDLLSAEDKGHLKKDSEAASSKAHASDDSTEDDPAGVISAAAQERKKKGSAASPGEKATRASAAVAAAQKKVDECEKVEEKTGKSCEPLREKLAVLTEEMRNTVAFASAEKGAADREQQAAQAAMMAEKANGNEEAAEALERVAEAKARKAKELEEDSDSVKGAGKEEISGYDIAAKNGTKLNEKLVQAEEAQEEVDEKKQNDAQTRLNVNVKKIKDKMKKVDTEARNKIAKSVASTSSSVSGATGASTASGASGASGTSGATGAKGPLEEGDDDDLPHSAEELRRSQENQAKVRKEIELALQRIRDSHNKDSLHVHEAAARVKKVLMENSYFNGDVDGKTIFDAAKVAGIPANEMSQNSQSAFDKAVEAKMGALHVAEEAEEKMAVYNKHDMERAASTGDCPERSRRGGFVDSRPELSEERQAWAKKVVADVHASSKPVISGSKTLLRLQRCAETCAVACAPCESAGSVLSFLALSSEERENSKAHENLYARTAISMAGYGLAKCEQDCMNDCQRHAQNVAHVVDKIKPAPEIDCQVCVDKFAEAGGCKAFKDHDMQKAEAIVKSIDPKCMTHQCGELAVKRCNVTSMFDDFQKPHEEKVSQHMAMLEEHEALQSAAAGLLAMMQKQKARQRERETEVETPQHAYRHNNKKNLRGEATGHGETMPGAVGFGPASKDPLEDAAKTVEEKSASKRHSHVSDVRFQGVGTRLHAGAKAKAKTGAKAKHTQGVKTGSDPWWLNPPPWWLPPPPEWGSPPPSIYSPFYSPYGGTSQGMHASAAHNAYPAYSPTPLPY